MLVTGLAIFSTINTIWTSIAQVCSLPEKSRISSAVVHFSGIVGLHSVVKLDIALKRQMSIGLRVIVVYMRTYKNFEYFYLVESFVNN